jgi:hypothetical protein
MVFMSYAGDDAVEEPRYIFFEPSPQFVPQTSLCKLSFGKKTDTDSEHSSSVEEKDSIAFQGLYRMWLQDHPTAPSLSPESLLNHPDTIPDNFTTIIVRNIPLKYTCELLLGVWPVDGTYDYLYLPSSYDKNIPMGYAFVNFTSREFMLDFVNRWNRQYLPGRRRAKRLNIGFADVQGLRRNVGRLQRIKLLPKQYQVDDPGALPLIFDRKTRLGLDAIAQYSKNLACYGEETRAALAKREEEM